MTDVYHIGCITTDTLSEIKGGYAYVNTVTRQKLTNFSTGDWIVTAGKTLNIGLVVLSNPSYTGSTITIMYDDDGVGTNETTVFVINGVASSYNAVSILNVFAQIPAQKYVTAKGSDTYVYMMGVEI